MNLIYRGEAGATRADTGSIRGWSGDNNSDSNGGGSNNNVGVRFIEYLYEIISYLLLMPL